MIGFKGIRNFCLVFQSIILLFGPLYSIDRTLGVIKNDMTAMEGYTLLVPEEVPATYLIDNYGRVINKWESNHIAHHTVYLLENGNLVRTTNIAPSTFGIEMFNWEGDLIWEYNTTTDSTYTHHDIEPLPNGNILMVTVDKKPKTEYVEAGLDPNSVGANIIWGERIAEYKPIGQDSAEIVWEWCSFDHLIQDFDPSKDNYGVVEDHPELMDVNYRINDGIDFTKYDRLHMNSVTYNSEYDQILVSNRAISEIWIIDHSTTTMEAAGHTGGTYGKGGDILYRWGNPEAYRAQVNNERICYFQHSPRWIPDGYPGAGDIILFNNGPKPIGDVSSVIQLTPPVDENGFYTDPDPGESYLPLGPNWEYFADPPTNLYSRYCSGTNRLPNGNTIIAEYDDGRLYEVQPDCTVVWIYKDPFYSEQPVAASQGEVIASDQTFNVNKYPKDYAAFTGKDLIPGAYIEINPISVESTIHSPDSPTDIDEVTVTSKIFDDSGITSADLHVYFGTDSLIITMNDSGQNGDTAAGDSIFTALIPALPGQIRANYYIEITDGESDEFCDPPFASKNYYFTYDLIPGTPENLTISRGQNSVDLVWNSVDGITEYKVYSSDDPYSGFSEDDSGSFDGASWSTTILNNKKFYYVVAVKN